METASPALPVAPGPYSFESQKVASVSTDQDPRAHGPLSSGATRRQVTETDHRAGMVLTIISGSIQMCLTSKPTPHQREVEGEGSPPSWEGRHYHSQEAGETKVKG